MKILVKLSILLALVCLCTSALAQQKSARKARNKSTTVCRVAAVPKGMVIVGYKPGVCPVAIVKRAANGDSICAGSPVPDGFTVYAQGMGTLPSSCPSSTFVIYSISADQMAEKSFAINERAKVANEVSSDRREWDRTEAKCTDEASRRTRAERDYGIRDEEYLKQSSRDYKALCVGREELKKQE